MTANPPFEADYRPLDAERIDWHSAEPARVLCVGLDGCGHPSVAGLLADRETEPPLTVRTAATGEAALAVLAADAPVSCIVSAYDLDGITGLELLETVRERTPDLPFVLLTESGSEAVASRAISAGVTDYVPTGETVDDVGALADRVVTAVNRYRAEREARGTHLALETAQEGISLLDADGKFTYVNRAYADTYGYDPADLVGEHWETLYPDQETEVVYEEILPQVAETGFWMGETTGLRADGTTFPEQHSLTRTDEGGLVCVVRDITERRERERELERRSRAMESAIDGMAILDENGEYVYVNEAHAEVYGYDDGDAFIGEHWRMCYDGAELDRFEEEIIPTLCEEGGGWRGEAVGKRQDGTTFPQELSLTVTDDGGLVCVVRDVTERKERERELRETAQQLQGILDTVEAGIFLKDTEGQYLLLNQSCRELVDIDADEDAVGLTDADLFPEAVATQYRTDDNRVFEANETVEIEETVPTPDGPRTHLTRKTPLFDAAGDPYAVCAVSTDITDRKERQRECELFRTLIDHSTDGVFVIDPDTAELLDANETACRRLGYDREALLDLSALDVEQRMPDRDAWRAHVEKVRAEGGVTFDGEHRRADGSTFPVEVNVTSVTLDREYMLAVARDVSERKERERYQRDLYRITADGDLSFDEKLDRLLDLGRERFELDAGLLAERVGDGYRVVDERGAPDVEEGVTTVEPHPKRFCSATVERDAPLAVADVAAAGWTDGPMSERFDPGCYLGVKVTVDGDVYGTLSFFDDASRDAPFTDAERTFLELMGQWVGYELARERHESQLAALNEMGRELMNAETGADVAAATVEHARERLRLPVTALVAYDRETGELAPVARTARAEDELPTAALCEPESGTLWEAFVADEVRVLDDIADVAGAGADLAQAVAVPLGRQGVFVTATGSPGGFGPAERDFVEATAATVKAAWTRTDRERQLHEREETLAEQNETLERLDRVNDIIRDIDQALVDASTREEIETVVCERLAAGGPYEFAWIGEHDAVSDRITPRRHAGAEKGYLDEITVTADETPTGRGPVGRAIRTHEPQVVDDSLADPSFGPWRQAALNRGYHACIALPLVYEETLYGVLVVYAGRPNAFDDLERAVLAEMADTIAHAINAVESKKALVGDEVTRMEFAVDDTDLRPVTMARGLGCEFSMENLVSRRDGGLRGYFSTRGAPAAEILACEDDMPVTDLTLVVECDEDDEPFALFEATLSDDSVCAVVTEHGGRLRELAVTDDTARVTVEVATDAVVREFVDMFRTKFPGAELVAQRTHERSHRTSTEVFMGVVDALTDRQLEALQTAYFSGYFEEPRLRSATDVAAAMDISQPTFNSHLRTAHRKVCRQLFDEASLTS